MITAEQLVPDEMKRYRHPVRAAQRRIALLIVFWLLGTFGIFWISPLAAGVFAAALPIWALASTRPSWLMYAMFAAMPFNMSVGGGGGVNASPTDCIAALVALALPTLWMRHRRVTVGPAGFPLLLFLGTELVSSVVHWDGLSTAVSLARMAMATLVAVLIFANADDRLLVAKRCFDAFLIGINALSLCSLFAFVTGGIHAAEYTLNIHKNALGPTFGCGIITALGFLFTEAPSPRRRLWLLATLAGATLGILFSLSRGGWVATGVGLLLLLVTTKNVRAFLISLGVMVPLLIGAWSLLPEDAVDYASNVSTQAHTVQTRFEVDQDVLKSFHDNPIFGTGVGLRKVAEPHNVVILTMGETGLIGLTGFLLMFAGGFATFVIASRYAQGNPVARQVIVAGSAVLLVSVVHGLMDVYWRRGVGFMGWSCVGMAANIIFLGQSGRLRAAAARVRRR